MKQLQQSIFLNLSKVSKYQERSKYISKPRHHFAKFREEEIRNEFELVDFNGSGKLSKEGIKSHLAAKYKKINFQLVDSVFATMQWDDQNQVTKEQFCSKYVQREKALYHEYYALASLRQRLDTIKDIYELTKTYKAKIYARINITKLFIRSEREGKDKEEWMDVEIQYEDHKNKLSYLIEQRSYGTEEPSFEVLLPAQDNYFFVKYKFHSPKGKEVLYGQCYVNVPILPNSGWKKIQRVSVDVIGQANEKKGYCQFSIQFETNAKAVEQYIEEMERLEPTANERSNDIIKQYEYLQYLWGVRHKYPHKIAIIDVKWMVVLRVVLLSLLALTSIVVQVLGRCEPLSFIIAMILGKNWKYVMLRSQKFLITWIGIAAVCLDLIWIAFGADQLSQINYLQLAWCSVLTYILIILKIVLLIYLLIVEKSFLSQEEEEENREKQ